MSHIKAMARMVAILNESEVPHYFTPTAGKGTCVVCFNPRDIIQARVPVEEYTIYRDTLLCEIPEWCWSKAEDL